MLYICWIWYYLSIVVYKNDKYIDLYNTKHDPKLVRLTLHGFRYSHISLLINNDINGFAIIERLRHSKKW